MIKNILVTTDFSPHAFKAVGYAAELALAAKATLHLLHVIEPSLNMVTMQTDSLSKKVLEGKKRDMDQALKAIKSVYPALQIVPFLSGGDVIASILDYSERENMELMVMGTQGAGGLKKIFVGSVTAGVSARTKIPLLAIPASYEVKKPSVVLFATNQFEKNRTLLDKVMLIPQLFSAAVHVVVFRNKQAEEGADFIYSEEQINDYLKFLRDNFPRIKFKGTLLEGEELGKSVNRYANSVEADLLTMVPYPKSFWQRLFQKSETNEMMHHPELPLFAVPFNLINSSTK